MRIALIHYRLQQKGGLESRLFNYIHYFVEQGHKVNLIVSKIDPSVRIPDSVKIYQIDIKRIPKPVRIWFFNRGLKKLMSQEEFDLSLSLGRTSHQDLVLCPGTHLGYMKALDMNIKGPLDKMNVYLDKLAYRDSKLILAASEKIREELEQFAKVDSRKIKVLYPPTNTAKFNQSGIGRKAELRTKYGFSKSKKSLLFITTGNHLKGYGFLLEVMEKLLEEPIELVIAGVKPMKTNLDNVRYLGYSEQVNELMWAADALVHPAKYEAFAQVVSESLLCGLPVIISNRVGAQSIVTGDVGRVVKGFDHENWIDTIKTVLNSKWNITPDFPNKYDLSVEKHCEQILAYGRLVSSK